MPNWCECDLEITGSEQEVCRFADAVCGKVGGEETLFDFNKIKPSPEEFSATPAPSKNDMKAKYGYDDWYEWSCAEWGTKWNACSVEREGPAKACLDEWVAKYTFETAWSPPIPVIKRAGELFPSLDFDLRYFERGVGFNGLLLIRQGTVTFDESGAYFGMRGG
jgi:hypothetical protein